jgi:hypothetical protein
MRFIKALVKNLALKHLNYDILSSCHEKRAKKERLKHN